MQSSTKRKSSTSSHDVQTSNKRIFTAAPEDMLSSLPAEIRNNVYDELFFNEGTTVHVDHREPNKLALLATSRLCHREASSFFYSRGHFVFPGPLKPTRDATILAPISDRHIRHLKRVTLSLWTGHTSLHEIFGAHDMLRSLSEHTEASIEEITIKISAAADIHLFIASRFDDSVMDTPHIMVDALKLLLQKQAFKLIRIQLNNTWFGPGVASCLGDIFTSHMEPGSDRSLQFFLNSNLSPENAVADLRKCERALVGRYYHDTADVFSTDTDDTSESATAMNSPASTASYTSVLNLGLHTHNHNYADDEDNSLASDDESAKYENMINFTPELFFGA